MLCIHINLQKTFKYIKVPIYFVLVWFRWAVFILQWGTYYKTWKSTKNKTCPCIALVLFSKAINFKGKDWYLCQLDTTVKCFYNNADCIFSPLTEVKSYNATSSSADYLSSCLWWMRPTCKQLRETWRDV